MAFPSDRLEMVSQGYKFSNYGVCRGCYARIEWWWTPSGQRIPMNPLPEDHMAATSHFATCPEVDQFKKSFIQRAT